MSADNLRGVSGQYFGRFSLPHIEPSSSSNLLKVPVHGTAVFASCNTYGEIGMASRVSFTATSRLLPYAVSNVPASNPSPSSATVENTKKSAMRGFDCILTVPSPLSAALTPLSATPRILGRDFLN